MYPDRSHAATTQPAHSRHASRPNDPCPTADRPTAHAATRPGTLRRSGACAPHLGLTQAELADELNTRQQTISEWERGAYRPRGPSARLLTRVAEDVSFAYEPGAPSTAPSTAPNTAPGTAPSTPRGSDAGDDQRERSHPSEPVSEHDGDGDAGGEATEHVEPGR